MIAFMLLLAAQPAVTATPPENEIVIIGQKVRKIKFRLKTDKAGKAVCRIKRSSGDPEIDALACDAARVCMHSASEAAMVACLTPKMNQIPARIAERRSAR
jgi:hypothetical protein